MGFARIDVIMTTELLKLGKSSENFSLLLKCCRPFHSGAELFVFAPSSQYLTIIVFSLTLLDNCFPPFSELWFIDAKTLGRRTAIAIVLKGIFNDRFRRVSYAIQYPEANVHQNFTGIAKNTRDPVFIR